MMVIMNGEPKDVAGKNLEQYLLEEGYVLSRVVVEKNLEILTKENLGNYIIQEDDRIEILHFVGGG